jgi:methanogenic corrinoid protein MtbC1
MELSEIIVEGDEKGARELTKKLLGKGIKAEDLVEELIHGMQIVGEKFERMEYFFTRDCMCSRRNVCCT